MRSKLLVFFGLSYGGFLSPVCIWLWAWMLHNVFWIDKDAVNEVTYQNFKLACYAWNCWTMLKNGMVVFWKHLYGQHVMITQFNCHSTNLISVFRCSIVLKEAYSAWFEDIRTLQRKRFTMRDIKLNDKQVENTNYSNLELWCRNWVRAYGI